LDKIPGFYDERCSIVHLLIFCKMWYFSFARTFLEENVEIKQSHYRPGQAVRVPGGWSSQISRQSAHEGGNVVSPTYRPPLPPGNIPCTHLCQRMSQPQGHVAAWSIMQMKNSNDIIGNQTRDFPVCSAVPQTTALPAASPGRKCGFYLFPSSRLTSIWTFFSHPKNRDITYLRNVGKVFLTLRCERKHKFIFDFWFL
jgi:hypothetical protein